MWRGTMRDFLLSRAALPASSRTSAAMYSSTAARYTGAPAPMREAYRPSLMWRCTRPTGNCKPALADRLVAFLPVFPLPRPDIVSCLYSRDGMTPRRDANRRDEGKFRENRLIASRDVAVAGQSKRECTRGTFLKRPIGTRNRARDFSIYTKSRDLIG